MFVIHSHISSYLVYEWQCPRPRGSVHPHQQLHSDRSDQWKSTYSEILESFVCWVNYRGIAKEALGERHQWLNLWVVTCMNIWVGNLPNVCSSMRISWSKYSLSTSPMFLAIGSMPSKNCVARVKHRQTSPKTAVNVTQMTFFKTICTCTFCARIFNYSESEVHCAAWKCTWLI